MPKIKTASQVLEEILEAGETVVNIFDHAEEIGEMLELEDDKEEQDDESDEDDEREQDQEGDKEE